MKDNICNIIYEIGKGCKADQEKLQQYLEQEIDECCLIGELAENRMCGIAYAVLRENQLLTFFHREIRAVLEAVYQHNCVKNQSFAVCKEQTAKLLYKTGVSYVALKGAYLTEIYMPGARISNDLDILIRRENLPILSSYLLKAGFVQGVIRNDEIAPASRQEILNALLNRGDVIPFVKAVNLPALRFLEIDINLTLNGQSVPEEQAVEEILNRRLKMNPQKRFSIYIPDAVDFLIQLCAHLYKEATNQLWIERGMDWTFYKFMDIFLFCQINLSKEFAQEFCKRAEQYDLEKECAYSLYYTNCQLKIPNMKWFSKLMGEGDFKNEIIFEKT